MTDIPITPDVAAAIALLRKFIKKRKQASVTISAEGWTRFEPTEELKQQCSQVKLSPLSRELPKSLIQIDESNEVI